MVNVDTAYRAFRPNLGPGTQAARVFAKFGGVSRVVDAMKEAGHPVHRSRVYRWNHSKEQGGTGGVVPTQLWAPLMAAARLYGILLTGAELDPRIHIGGQ